MGGGGGAGVGGGESGSRGVRGGSAKGWRCGVTEVPTDLSLDPAETLHALQSANPRRAANSKHWFTTSFLQGGRCRKAMLGVWASCRLRPLSIVVPARATRRCMVTSCYC